MGDVIHNQPAAITAPSVDWNGWYVNASPGPHFPCAARVAARRPRSTTTPLRSNTADAAKQQRQHLFQLLRPAVQLHDDRRELAWNSTTRVLTVTGTFFIDGSAKIENGTINSLQRACDVVSLGNVAHNKNSKLCALMSGANCDFTQNRNPSARLLVIVANGKGGQVPADTGIQLVSSHFQGALFRPTRSTSGRRPLADGPISTASRLSWATVSNSAFQGSAVVPVGMPGNPAVYAQPNPPQLYSG